MDTIYVMSIIIAFVFVVAMCFHDDNDGGGGAFA